MASANITVNVGDVPWLLAIMRVRLADRLRERARYERPEVAVALRRVASEFEAVDMRDLPEGKAR